MSLLGEIYKLFGGEIATHGGYNIVNMSGNVVYVDGIDRIVYISPAKISLQTKHDLLFVEGLNLVLAQSSQDTVVIRGNIQSISTESGD